MCIRRRQKNSFAVFSVMAASLYFAQRQQALKQNVIEHHNGCYRTEVDRSFVAIESGDIAFIEYNAAQADRACRQVDAQVVASDRADLTCNGSRLKIGVLAFDAIFSSNSLQMTGHPCSRYLQMSLQSTAPARIPWRRARANCKYRKA